MGKIVWKPGTMVYPLPAVLVSCGTIEAPNLITIAWTGTLCTNPTIVYISVRPERLSYDLIKKTGNFAINLTTTDMARATDYCGVKSGRDVDKFKETGLTPIQGQCLDIPIIKESPLALECELMEIKPLGSHDLFIAKVMGVTVEDSFLDESGKFRLDQAGLIAYSHGAYYELGEKLGTFGYSIMKKKTRIRKQKKSGGRRV